MLIDTVHAVYRARLKIGADTTQHNHLRNFKLTWNWLNTQQHSTINQLSSCITKHQLWNVSGFSSSKLGQLVASPNYRFSVSFPMLHKAPTLSLLSAPKGKRKREKLFAFGSGTLKTRPGGLKGLTSCCSFLLGKTGEILAGNERADVFLSHGSCEPTLCVM